MGIRTVNDLADYQAIAGDHIDHTLTVLQQVRDECRDCDFLQELLAQRPPDVLDNAAAPLAFAFGLSSEDRVTRAFERLFSTVLIQRHQFERLLFNLSYASDQPRHREKPCCAEMLEINAKWNSLMA
ncbi:MAG: hypothetical protein PHO20_05105, partial [Candidatus Peribacteraceae bacterium]|nr:hypothetical protein [Candidatus Peribacteraceae bacterium]